MPRNALRRFLRGLVAALPLGAAPACNQDALPPSSDGSGPDAARISDLAGGKVDLRLPPSDMAIPASDGPAVSPDMAAPRDMAVPVFDLAGVDLYDMCAGPAVTKNVPYPGDGGTPDCATICLPGRPMGFQGPIVCQVVKTDGGQALECTYSPCGFGGRAPAGLRPSRERGGVGGWLARVAHLEAASVLAFARLAGELSAHGAPGRLVAAARRAGRDEVRHARVTSALAGRYGAEVEPVEVAPVGGRSLEAIAVENAVEGCVGETWGALLAMWQGERAGDPVVRAAMAQIAVDETRHAELAWEVDAWAAGRLDRAARARVIAARSGAARELAARLSDEPSDEMVGRLGLPSATSARSLVEGVARGLCV